MKQTAIISILVTAVTVMISSCSREDRFNVAIDSQETHTVFNISVAKNTKTKTKSSRAGGDSKTSYDTDKTHAYIDSNIAFGVVGIDSKSYDVLVDNQPVHEINGVRTANLVTSCHSSGTMNVSAFYPYVTDVDYHKEDGSYVISFKPNDIEKGPLASNAVEMRCDQEYETVNLKFHHISNSIGFKVCDITSDEQLKGLMYVRKVVLHGMPTEGLFVCAGDDSHWIPQSKRNNMVVYEGNDFVEYGEENALFLAKDRLSYNNDDCSRFYVIPEELKEGKHYVEVIFDVDSFDYDGTHYRGLTGMSQIIPLSGIIPDDFFELGLQYTFVLGMNLGTVYRPIEFTASVEDYELLYNGRVLDYDNE
jgi:hypothetical protein